jgi:hypothetical protein
VLPAAAADGLTPNGYTAARLWRELTMRRWFLSYNSQDLALMQSFERALRNKDAEAEIFFARATTLIMMKHPRVARRGKQGIATAVPSSAAVPGAAIHGSSVRPAAAGTPATARRTTSASVSRGR